MSITASLVLLAALAPQEWPRFAGPAADNTSPATGLARSFPEGGPPVHWTAEVMDGYGGAAVRDGEVYILDRLLGEKDVLRVLDLETGAELWRFEFEVAGRLMFPGARSVPTVEEDLVYVQGGFGQLYCIDRESHELEWMVDAVAEFGGELPQFGYSNSPLVHEDLVLVTPLGGDVGMVALDRFIGEEMWRTEGIGSSHSTPCLLELMGRPQFLMIGSTMDLSAFAGAAAAQPEESSGSAGPPGEPPSVMIKSTPVDSVVPEEMADMTIPGIGMLIACSPDGELLWSSDAFYCSTAIPNPIRVDDHHLFLTGGYEAGSVLLRLEETDEGVKTHEVFRMKKGSQIHLPILHDQHLYILVNENKNDPRRRRNLGGLMCLDLEGNEMWRTGADPYFGRGTMILADGMLLVQDGLNGTLRMVEPTPEEYRPVAEVNVFGIDDRKDHQMWAPMALADGRLLMRSQTELKCLDLRPAR